jgi:hypothetical protein
MSLIYIPFFFRQNPSLGLFLPLGNLMYTLYIANSFVYDTF